MAGLFHLGSRMADLDITGRVVVDGSQAEGAFDRVADKAEQMGREVSSSANKAGQAVDKIGDGADKGAEKFTRAEARMRDSIKRSTRELEMLGKTASQKFEANLEFKGLDKAKFQPFLSELRKAEEATKRAETGINSMSATAQIAGRAMALAFSGAAITGFLGKVVSVQREFDVLNSSLTTVTGSSAAAERELMWLKDFAKTTPFGLAQATQGFVKMKALGLDPTRAALASFGNTASAMGKDLNQMIEAVADASTGEFERLKEFGIKAKKEGDNVSLTFQGVTTTIGNSAREITKYLEDIGNTSFGGAMEERAKTLDGTIAALGDTWDELFRTVSTNNVGSLIFDSVTLANGVLEDATTIVRAMGGAASDAGKDFGALTAIQGGVATFFETVAVLAANTLYVLRQTGDTMAGVAAGYKAFFSFDFDAVRAIGAEMKANGEAARKEIDATTARILNARKEAGIYASYATRNASAATDPRRIDLGGASVAAARAASAGVSKAVKEAVSEYDKLIKKLSEELPKAAAEAEAAQMGYNKAQTEFLALAGSEVWAKFTNSQRATVAALFENKIASEQSAEAAKTLAKANLDAAASREKYLTSLDTGLDKIKADTAAQIDATARLGLSKEAIAALDAAKLEMLATDLELQAIKALDRNLDEQTYNALKQQAAAYRDLAKAKQGFAAKESAMDLEKASIESAKKAEEEWRKTADSINQSLTDALLRGFESGKDFAKNLRDTVVNMFKTLVLRPVISAVVSPVAGALTGALGLSGTANAATGSSSLLSGASSLSTIYNISSAALTGVGSAVAGAIGSTVSTFLGTTAGNAAIASALGYGTGAATAAATGAAVAGGAGVTAAAGAAASGAGLASSVLTAVPYVAVAALVANALGLFKTTKRVDGGISGTLGEGSINDYSVMRRSGSLFSGPSYSVKDVGVAAQSEAIQTAYKAVRDVTANMADTLGVGSDAIRNFTQRLGNDLISADNGDGRGIKLDGLTGEQAAAKVQEALATANNAIAAQVLAGTAFARTGETSIDTLSRLSGSLTAVNSTFDLLGLSLIEASLAGGNIAGGIVDAFGGLERLNTLSATYYDNFFSESEKAAKVTEQVTDALKAVGLEMPITREAFRALVESQAALGTEGQAAYVALLNVSGAFASVVPAATEAAQAIGGVLSETMRRLQSDSSSLQIELLQAQGRESDALALRREIETQGFNAAEVAAYDYNQSLRASITATNAASAALKAYKTAASSISTSKDTIAGVVRSPAEIAQNALNESLAQLNATLKPANVVKDDFTYLSLYEDVFKAFQAETGKGGPLEGMTRQEYERIHFESSGKSEGRMSPQEALDLITTLVPNYNPLTLDDVLKLDTSGQGGYSAEQWEIIADVFAKAANVKLAAETPVTPATSVVDTSNAALSDILQERMTLQERYDALTMTSTQLLEKQRNALDESNRALFDQVQVAQTASDTLAEQKGLQKQIDELTLSRADLLGAERGALFEGNRALFDRLQALKTEAEVTRERTGLMTQLYQALGNTAALRAETLQGLDPANRGLQQQIYQIEDAKDALEKALQADMDSANAAQQAAQERVGTIKSIFDTLKSNVDSLYDTVEATKAFGAAQANAFIDNALSNARATGYLPDGEDLTRAISGARGGLDKPYATEFEKQRDTLVLAGKLSELQSISGGQLTAAKRQLQAAEAQVKALDSMQAQGRAMLDSLSDNTKATLSIVDAITQLGAAIAAARVTTSYAAAAPQVAQMTAGLQSQGRTAAYEQYGGGLNNATYAITPSGTVAIDVGNDWSAERIAAQATSNIASFAALGNTEAVTAVQAWAKGRGIPGFAVGTNYVPRDMLAQIHEGEAIVPKAYNPAAGGGSSNAKLEGLVEALTSEVKRLQTVVNDGNREQRRTANAVNGNPDMPMLVQTV